MEPSQEKGVILSTILSNPATSEERALRLLSATSKAVSALHRADFVHRDTKPETVVVKLDYGADGSEIETDDIRLIDLGSAIRDGTP